VTAQSTWKKSHASMAQACVRRNGLCCAKTPRRV
jgi:hypothetical protein